MYKMDVGGVKNYSGGIPPYFYRDAQWVSALMLRRDIVTAWHCHSVTMLWPDIRCLKYEPTLGYIDRREWHDMSVWQLPGMISCCGVTLLRRDNGTAWHKMFEV